MGEIWKDIKGYEGLYQVSNLGRVKSLPRNNVVKVKILKPYVNNKGYCSVSLSKNNKAVSVSIYKLVAQAFVYNKEHKKEIDHINGIRCDDRATNLRWCTHKENCNFPLYRKNSSKDGCWMYKRTYDLHPRAKRIEQYSKEGNLIRVWNCAKEACDVLNLNRGAISECCHGKRNYHGGFIWKFEE